MTSLYSVSKYYSTNNIVANMQWISDISPSPSWCCDWVACRLSPLWWKCFFSRVVFSPISSITCLLKVPCPSPLGRASGDACVCLFPCALHIIWPAFLCVHRSWFLLFCVRPACIPSPKKETSYCTSSLILSRDLTMSRGVCAFGHLRMCKLTQKSSFVMSLITLCCNLPLQADDSDWVCGIRPTCGSHSGGSRTLATVLGTG